MPYDGLVTNRICTELSNILIDGKVDKIIQPTKDEVVIFVRKNRNTYKLILSANAENARVHITNSSFENPSKPFNFCMVLRKYLLGAHLLEIIQPNNDRILSFTFENSNELGDKETKKLIIEMMGKYSNVILTTLGNTIVDALKHVDFEISSVREVMPGREYLLPLNGNKINPHLVSEELFNNLIVKNSQLLSSSFIGIATLAAKEIAPKNFNEFTEFLNYSGEPVILKKDGQPVDFYFFPLKNKFPDYYTVSTMSAAIDAVFLVKKALALLNQEKNILGDGVSHALTKAEKKLKIVEDKIATTSELENLRIEGELLSSNLYKVQPYSKEIAVENYYTGKPQTIELNPNLSPSENLQRLFKKYTKMRNTLSSCSLQKEELLHEISYLESLFFEIYCQESIEDLDEIKEELIAESFIKKQGSKKKEILSKPLLFDFNGFEIYVGKNNIQNDKLTFKTASKDDIWLHVKNAPGSHTIIKSRGLSVPIEVLEKAASLAAFHSKLKNSPKVDIDYTQVKNVKKIPGAKPGMVIYENFKTIYIAPSDH